MIQMRNYFKLYYIYVEGRKSQKESHNVKYKSKLKTIFFFLEKLFKKQTIINTFKVYITADNMINDFRISQYS